MNLVVEAFGEKEVSRTLLRFATSAEDMRPAFDEVHEDFLELEKQQFEGQGIGPSGAWAPLAASTVAEKARLGIDRRILYGETGDLFRSLTSRSGQDVVYEVTPDAATMASAVAYGVYHQSRAPRERLPRRPPVDLPESAKIRWIKVLQRHLIGGGVVE